MKPIKFIHCADLHLDSPFVGLRNLPEKIYETTKQSTFTSFSKIIETAIQKQVDFIIIAGDLYDGEDRSIRAQLYFRKEMEKLQQEGIDVFLVHGNHDHLGGNWTELNWPKNVHSFPATVETISYETKSCAKIHFYGFSYPKKHVFERMIDYYQKKEGADYHIGILHGHDSKNENHYSYAPFQIKELLEKNFDYWALGHIHKAQILHTEPMILYPGNIQGRHKKETGAKGCYLIEMNGMETKADFIETAPIRWETCQLTSDQQFHQFDDLYYSLIRIKDHWRQKETNIFLQIILPENILNDSLKKQIDLEDILSIMQEGEEEQEHFVWIYQIKLEKNEVNDSSISDEFFRELKQQFRDIRINEPLSALYNHSKIKKYVSPLTEGEQQEIIHEAEKLLFQLLKSKG